MRQLVNLIFLTFLIVVIYWFAKDSFGSKDKIHTDHQILIEQIEAMGKLELVKYQVSDIIQHTNKNTYLPDASVLLIVKADAVGCIDLTKVQSSDITTIGDSVIIQLPHPEICYVKIDHAASRVYDTKMAFFQEADLVDEAYRFAEVEIKKKVQQSDILQQTKNNATHILQPLLAGLGYKKLTLVYN